MRRLPLGSVLVGAFALLLAGASAGGAQGDKPSLGSRYLETRPNLEAQLKAAQDRNRSVEAGVIQARLTEGDFRVGDKIYVMFDTGIPPVIAETLVVRDGKILEIPKYPALNLTGVLHVELRKKVTDHLAEYVKDPVPRVVPLVLVAVQGAVIRPGAHYASPDAPLSDVFAQAGQSSDADWRKSVVTRGGTVIWAADDLQRAIADGLSIDRLQMRTGDVLEVPKVSQRNWLSIIQLTLSISGLIATLVR